MHLYYTEVVFIYCMYILYTRTQTHTHTFLPHTWLPESPILQVSFYAFTDRLCFSSHFSQISKQLLHRPIAVDFV